MSAKDTLTSISARALAGLRRSLRNHHYEEGPNGLLLPAEKLWIGGQFTHDMNGLDEQLDHNLVTVEGRNHILDTVLHNQAQVATWYIALFSGNVVPQPTWTAANFVASAGEFTGYDELTRVEYNEGAANAGVINNHANKGVFTINATATIYGGALLSSSVKSGTAGKLMSAARFSNARNGEPTDTLNVGYQISLTST